MHIYRTKWERSRNVSVVMIAAVTLLAGLSACSQESGAASCEDTEQDGDVSLRFSWWGAEERATVTEQVIDLFEKENPGVTIKGEYSDWEGYWTDMSTQAAGGGLADIVQMDFSYLKQFAGPGLLLDMNKAVDAKLLSTDNVRDGFLETGIVNDELVGLPMGGNTLGMFYRPDVFEELGIEAPQQGWTWADYHDIMTQITEADVQDGIHGGIDYTGQYHFMDLWLRQNGQSFYTQDGELGFDKAMLTEWWGLTADLREDVLLPPETVTELKPATALGSGVTATEIGWDNFMGRFYGDGPDNEYLLAPLPSDTGESGQYIKPSMQLGISSQTQYCAQAAKFVDFFLNDPKAAAILGVDRGIPATKTGLEAVDLSDIDQQVLDFEDASAELITDPPPPPPPGTGSVEAHFLTINEDLNYGEISLADAVDRFFEEAQTSLEENRLD